jgi:hypothetical protein
MRLLPVEPTPTALTPAFAARVSEVAATSPIVRRNLGDRFAFINAVLVDEDKERGGELLPAEQQLGRVTFYSYSRNVAVRALVRAGEVLEVRDVEGFQPPESPEEIERAVRLAREDRRIAGLVRNLEGMAMVTEPGEGRPGSGHRVLYVSFAPAGTRTAEVMALVDLTDNRIIEAGPTPGVR